MRPHSLRHFLPAVGLCGVVCLVFGEAFFRGRIFFERDIHAYWYPMIENFVRAVSEGSWPLWNRHVAFGLPLLANPALQVFYPPTWLNLVLLPSTYYKLFVLLHCWSGSFGLYLLGRRWGLSPPGAFLAGAVWCASGPLLSAVSLFHHFAGAAWIPWVLLALEKSCQERTLASTLRLAAVGAGQALAGSADLCMVTGLAGTICLLSFPARSGRPFLRSVPDLVARASLSLVVAILLSAVQWLPTLALLRTGVRLMLGPDANLYWSVHPASLIDLLVPRLVEGLPMSTAVRGVLFESREPLLSSLYFGAAASVLAGLALVRGPRGAWALPALLLVFFLLMALGRHGLLLTLMLELPAFSLFRYPAKQMIVAGLFWGLLVGRGFDAWRGDWSRPEQRAAVRILIPAAVLAALALLAGEWIRRSPDALGPVLASADAALAPSVSKLRRAAGCVAAVATLLGMRRLWPKPRPWLTASLVGVVLADLVSAGRGVNNLAPPELMAHRPPLLAKLESDAPPRLFVLGEPMSSPRRQLARGPAGWEPGWIWALGLQEMLWPPIGARWQIDGSYDGNFTGLEPHALSVFAGMTEYSIGTPLALKFLQMGNVGYVVALRDGPFPYFREVAQVQSVFAAPIRLFRVPDPLPRTYVVDGVRVASEPASYAVLVSPGFDPRREVVVASGVADAAPHAGFRGESRILWQRSDAVGLYVETSAPAYVVLVEAYDPGWEARVDGVAAPVLRANVLFRAVPVPPGRHRVDLRYRPQAVLWGGGITFLCTMAVLVALERERRRAEKGLVPSWSKQA